MPGTAYGIESRDPFGVSCQLHQGELTRFHDAQAPVALDLAGYHARDGQAFTCIACHVGEGVGGRLRVLFFAGMDVANYTGGSFQRDLDGMKHRSPTPPARSATFAGRSAAFTPRPSTRDTRRHCSDGIPAQPTP